MIVWSVASAVPQRAVKTIVNNDFHRGLKTEERMANLGLRPVAAPYSF